MIHAYSADTADELWLQLVAAVREKGVQEQSSRLGSTSELLHTHIALSNIRERWVLSRTPALNPAFAIAEVFWILSGQNESEFLNKWNPALPRFAGKGAKYHGAYGYRLKRHFGLDQVERAYKILSSDPDSRQCVLQIWDPRSDLPFVDGMPRSEDIPCNLTSVLKVRNGRLEWLQVLRSNDLYRGLPYNIVQFTTLQEVLAGWLGLEPGEYHQVSDSSHLYVKDNVHVRRVDFAERNNDSLAAPKEISCAAIRAGVRALEDLSADNIHRENLVSYFSGIDVPSAYRNLVMIAAADNARRKGWYKEMELLEERCTNPVLRLAWAHWKERTLGKIKGGKLL